MGKVARIREDQREDGRVSKVHYPPPARKTGLDDWIGPLVLVVLIGLLGLGIKEIIDILKTAW